MKKLMSYLIIIMMIAMNGCFNPEVSREDKIAITQMFERQKKAVENKDLNLLLEDLAPELKKQGENSMLIVQKLPVPLMLNYKILELKKIDEKHIEARVRLRTLSKIATKLFRNNEVEMLYVLERVEKKQPADNSSDKSMPLLREYNKWIIKSQKVINIRYLQ